MSLAEYYEWDRPDDKRTWVWCETHGCPSISHPVTAECTVKVRVAWQPGDPT